MARSSDVEILLTEDKNDTMLATTKTDATGAYTFQAPASIFGSRLMSPRCYRYFEIVRATYSHQRPADVNGATVSSRDGEHRRYRSTTIG
jgi:hypothetical protein